MEHFIKFRTLAVAASATLLLAGQPAQAQSSDNLTTEQLIETLKTVKTRSFDPNRRAREAQFENFIDTLRTKKTRQITVNERTEVANFVKQNKLPSIDLEVYFDYDSSEITPSAKPKLTTLGQALSDAQLKGKTFLIAGHTDSHGSDQYNQSLSERRAEAVKQFLSSSYGLDPTTLVAIGYGEEQLKNSASPEADENRRVQVVTLGN